jgi:signal transduction histidine kinase
VTEDRWIACAVRDEIAFGLEPGGELQVATTICDEIRNSGQAVVIDHVAEDVAFRDHPTPKMYGFQSYISMPIFSSGRFFGTLCAIDPRPAKLNTPEIVGMFRLFADLIAFHLDAQERLRLSETALVDERHTAQLREQFIAVLGHDLRNPLNAIAGGSTLLQRMALDAQAVPLVSMVQRSAARMAGLIDNLMDFARGRLGGGFVLDRAIEPRIQEMLEQVVAEARIAWPQRDIQSEFSLSGPVECDGARVAQLLSNLLTNALIHGNPEGAVRTRAHTNGNSFQLSVTNTGEPIPLDIVGRLFLPFSRASEQSNQQGLGLGLYIASEIARAHEGSLEVVSTEAETCFTFTMKLKSS